LVSASVHKKQAGKISTTHTVSPKIREKLAALRDGWQNIPIIINILKKIRHYICRLLFTDQTELLLKAWNMAQQMQFSKKGEKNFQDKLSLDLTADMPDVAVTTTPAENTASPYKISRFILPGNERLTEGLAEASPQGGGSPQYSQHDLEESEVGNALPGRTRRSLITPEEKRNRAGAIRKARCIKKRMFIKAIKQKTNLAFHEKMILKIVEEQRQRRNAKSRQRAIKKKEDIERILATPKSMRTNNDREILQAVLTAKQKKNEADRQLRHRIKEEKKKKNYPAPRLGRPPKYHQKLRPATPSKQQSKEKTIQLKSPEDIDEPSLPIQASPSLMFQIDALPILPMVPVKHRKISVPTIPPFSNMISHIQRPSISQM